MTPLTLTVSASVGGNSHSGIYVPDRHISPFSIGFGANVATTCKYTIQHTFQDPLQTSAAALVWYANKEVTATGANYYSSYSFPVAGIRVEASVANEGGVSVTFVQAGIVS